MSHAYERDANRVGALVLALADRVQAATAQAAGQGPSAAAALAALHGTAGGASIDGLARIVGLTHSGAVRLVDRLAAAGLVERRMGVDQRSLALRLTPAGRRAARRVLAQRAAVLEATLGALPAGDRAAFGRIADRLLTEIVAGGDPEQRVCRLCDGDACGRPQGDCPVQRAARTEPRP